MVAEILAAHSSFMEGVTGVASTGLAVGDFRVTLDLPRQGVQRLPQAPLNINGHTVGD